MTAMWGDGGDYTRWADGLERWATGNPDADTSTLPPLDPEGLPPDTWERLLRRIGEAIETRLQAWADALTAALSAAPDEFSAGRALAQARAGLHPVRSLAAHPGLPEEIRAGLTDLVDRQIRSLQSDLERDVGQWSEDPRPAEARLRTLRDNPLTSVLALPPAPTPPLGTGWSHDPAAPPRRRVITNP